MRLRITFSKTEAMRFTGHLDLHRAWERTFRRAALPLAYTQGFSPHPRINLASALPLGFTSEAEVLDSWLEQPLPVDQLRERLANSAPPGIKILGLTEVDANLPALQTELEAQEYSITLLDELPELDVRIQKVLEEESILRERRRKTYDLRPLILELSLIPVENPGSQKIRTLLSAKEGATGRPEEVIAALGGIPVDARYHRTRLIFRPSAG